MKNQKLTLVSFMCRSRKISAFVYLPLINNKPVISMSKICDLFFSKAGFYPTRGETISIGI